MVHYQPKNQITDGVIRIHNHDGSIYKEYYKINNKKEGPFKKFNLNGNLIYICNYVNNRKNGDEFCYNYDNHNILETKIQYCNGKKNGEVKHYDQNGNIKSIINFTNDLRNGDFIFYDENQNIIEKGVYIDNKKIIEYTITEVLDLE
jgi:antitoxin component YwqK of YwqJK toxin-antitoxin module